MQMASAASRSPSVSGRMLSDIELSLPQEQSGQNRRTTELRIEDRGSRSTPNRQVEGGSSVAAWDDGPRTIYAIHIILACAMGSNPLQGRVGTGNSKLVAPGASDDHSR